MKIDNYQTNSFKKSSKVVLTAITLGSALTFLSCENKNFENHAEMPQGMENRVAEMPLEKKDEEKKSTGINPIFYGRPGYSGSSNSSDSTSPSSGIKSGYSGSNTSSNSSGHSSASGTTRGGFGGGAHGGGA